MYSFTSGCISGCNLPSINIASSALTITENNQTATITATLDEQGTCAGQDVVIYLELKGSAAREADYSIESDTLIIPYGELSSSIEITSIDDNFIEGTENIEINILDIDGGIVSNIQSIFIDITDDTEDSEYEYYCSYTFELFSGGNSGWDGAYIELLQDGDSITSFTLNVGETYQTIEYLLPLGVPIEFVWRAGNNDETVDFGIYKDDLSNTIFDTYTNGKPTNNQIFLDFETDCNFMDVNTLAANVSSLVYLGGRIEGDGNLVNIYFEWGETVNLGNFTSNQEVTEDGEFYVGQTLNINNFKSGKRYYYRLMATRGNNTAFGQILSFVVPKEYELCPNDFIATGRSYDDSDVSFYNTLTFIPGGTVIRLNDDAYYIAPAEGVNAGASITYRPYDNYYGENGTYPESAGIYSGQPTGFSNEASSGVCFSPGSGYFRYEGDDTGSKEHLVAELNLCSNWTYDSVPGGSNGTPKILTILNPYFPPSVALNTPNISLIESGGQAEVQISLSHITSCQDVTITLEFSGVASQNEDYIVSSSTFIIPHGSTSATLILTSLDDALLEGDENIIVRILEIKNALPGTQEEIQLTLLDDEAGSPVDEFPGGALVLADPNDKMEITDGIPLDGVFTYEAWIKPTQENQPVSWVIGENGGAYLLQNADVLEFYIYDDTNHIGPATATLPSTDNSILGTWWYHLAAVYDGTQLQIYVNGEKGTDFVYTGSNVSLGNPFTLGSQADFSMANALMFDEVRIWSVVRSQAELRSNMHLVLNGSEAGLEAYWQFNETQANSLIDATGRYNAFSTSTERAESQVPVGSGVSFTASSAANTFMVFGDTGLGIEFGAVHPEGELVVTRINQLKPANPSLLPDYLPLETYWVVNNYGTTRTGLDDMRLRFWHPELTFPLAQDYRMGKRGSTEYGDWENPFTPTAIQHNEYIDFEGITHFSQLGLHTFNSPLSAAPIQLTARRVASEEVLLTWQTFGETFQKFIIEHSEDGLTFSPIAELPGNAFQWREQRRANAYYRIKVKKITEIWQSSPSVFVEGLPPVFTLSPNPGSVPISVKADGLKEEMNVRVYLYSVLGVQLQLFNGTINELNKTLNLWAAPLSAGMYYFHFEWQGHRQVIKWVRE